MKNSPFIGNVAKTSTIKILLFFLMGVTAFGCMDKEEDPSLPMYPGVPNGTIVSIDLRGIVLSSDPTVVFTFTALNANEVVYASRQDTEGYIAITWERFNEPYVDQYFVK